MTSLTRRLMYRFIHPLTWIVLSFVSFHSYGAAPDSTGACDKYDFSRSKTSDGSFDYPHPVYVIDNTVKAVMADGSSPVALKFGQVFYPISERINDLAVKVRVAGERKTGWIDKAGLLCSYRPAKTEKGIERKAYIKGQLVEVGQKNQRWVRPNPSMKGESCNTTNDCKQVSRFDFSFIFLQRGQELLIGTDFKLNPRKKSLLGWVNEADIYEWNSNYGLRPTKTPGDELLCIFKTLEQAQAYKRGEKQASQHCKPVDGGEGWFQTEKRLPLLDITPDKQFYKVAFPSFSALYNTKDGKKDGKLGLPGDSFESIAQPITSNALKVADLRPLESKKNKDIMFLIDGTQSMQGAIDAIRGSNGQPGIIQRFVDTIVKDPQFAESKFRFGYHVYRDIGVKMTEPSVDDSGFDDMNCTPTDEGQAQNRRLFTQRLANLKVSKSDTDDFAEDSYGGLQHVLRKELRHCKDNLKIVIMIGDHGDDHPQDILPYLVNKQDKKGVMPLYFIQTPKSAGNYFKSSNAQLAYDKYHNQALDLLSQTKQPATQFYIADDNALVNKLVDSLRGATAPVIGDLMLDISSGKAFTESVKKLKIEYAKRGFNIPPVVWDITARDAKAALGLQYGKRIMDNTISGYIVVDPTTFIEEVWLLNKRFTRWRNLVDNLEHATFSTGTAMRKEFIKLILLQLETLLKKPPYSEVGGTIAEYIARSNGLPNSEQSPLLQYGEDLEDPTLVPNCEFVALQEWVSRASEILGVVSNDHLPLFTAEYGNDEICEGISNKGLKIPYIFGGVSRGAICAGSSDCSFEHQSGGERVYWIPREYLP